MSNQKSKRSKGVKRETLWLGFSRKFGYVLPWIWGHSRASCRPHTGSGDSWQPDEYVRHKVRIVPISPKHKAPAKVKKKGGK